MKDHLRAVAVLLLCAFMLFQGTPGIDSMGSRELKDADDIAEVEAVIGPLWTGIAVGIADWNREHRLPLHKKLHVLEQPIRGAQNWGLYRDGPGKIRRMEIWVDGELKHRSADDEYTWLNAQLRMRRVRPMVETTTIGREAQNWRGLSRFICERAAEELGAETVEIRATEQKFPGTGPVTVHHKILAAAPEWELLHL
ncbi:MAG: hypothetical protein GY913_15905 [Proteobacteria bacterium]|nr:hypothetical protein [Pseudomonadota bacterium]MCP4918390.1 hypothetical protein [Pseudomonadota bacterium]